MAAGLGVGYEQRDLNDAGRRAMVVGEQADQVSAVKGLVVKGSLAEARVAATRVLKHEAWPGMFFGVDGQGRPQLKNNLENVKQARSSPLVVRRRLRRAGCTGQRVLGA